MKKGIIYTTFGVDGIALTRKGLEVNYNNVADGVQVSDIVDAEFFNKLVLNPSDFIENGLDAICELEITTDGYVMANEIVSSGKENYTDGIEL